MKKRVMIITEYCNSFTGFGRNAKALYSYLYKNYGEQLELITIATGMPASHPDYARCPWITEGVLPDDQREVEQLQKDGNVFRMASYGEASIEHLVYKHRPDVILIINDQWGTSFIKNKSFFGKIPVVFWITLDSLPIQEEAFKDAKNGTQYWCWSQFATDALHKDKELSHVKTQYPNFNTNTFYRLSDMEKRDLRKKFNLHPDVFIFLMIFRNQPRKLVNKLIEGYSIFKKQHPEIKNTRLLLHTNWSEGWPIPKLCEQYGVPLKEVLCTYVCRATRDYYILPFMGQDIDNPRIPGSKSLITVNIHCGVSEEQLNEIYNLSNFYIHPVNSGAAELPCIEAGLAELSIATCGYSYGEDIIDLNKGSIPIQYNFTTEYGTNFLKANPDPNSIAKIIYKVHSMKPEKLTELGKLSRDWALNNYDVNINGKKIAETLLSIPPHSFDFNIEKITSKNDKYLFPEIENPTEFLKDLYKNILLMELPGDDVGLNGWLKQIENGADRHKIYDYFINVARDDNAKAIRIKFEDLLGAEDEGKRILITIPESAGDVILAAALLEDIKNLYPDHNIYFACKKEFHELLEGNPYIFRMLPWISEMDSIFWSEGQSDHKGFFQVSYLLHAGTQRFLTYLHNGIDRTNLIFNSI